MQGAPVKTREALLAIDVGGSTTRAFVLDLAGHCLGYGRSTGGNPASNTPELAATALIGAVKDAVADAGGAFDLKVAQLGLAGPRAHVAQGRIETAFREAGLSGPIAIAGDLLAMFASASPAIDGYGVVVGTGAGAVRIRGGEIVRVADAAGWLIGDFGSGYWLGHEAAKAVCAELDGRGETTALTTALLDRLGIPRENIGAVDSRPSALRLFIDKIYSMRPIEMAQFAPQVIACATDPVAARLKRTAEAYVVKDFATVYDKAMPGPVAMGGGVAAHLPGIATGIAEIISAAGHVPSIHLVADGSIGAAVLGFRTLGVTVDAALFDTIAASINAKVAARRS